MPTKVLKAANVLSIVAVGTATVATEYMLILGYRFRTLDEIIDIICNVED